MTKLETAWTLLMLITVIATVKGKSGNDTKALLKKLFVTDEYNKIVRPRMNQSDAVEITIELFLKSITNFDEQEESITIACYLGVYWIDDYLAWSPSDHNGIKQLFIPQDQVWKPDVSLENSYQTFTGLGSSFYNMLVSDEGDVLWEPFQVLKSTCSVDITYFPFDTQSCDLKFIAWSYIKEEVTLVLGMKTPFHTDRYSENSAWELVGTASQEADTLDAAAVIFTIQLKRKPMFYIMNVAIPVVLLTVLNVFTFALPASSGERNGFAITVFLALAVFLTIVAAEMPKNSDVVSIFGVYLTTMTMLSTFVVIACLLLTRLAARDKTHPIGRGFYFLHNMSQAMQCKRSCSRKNKVVTTDNSEKKVKLQEDTAAWAEDVTWEDVVHSLDFLCFWFTLALTFGCTTTLVTLSVYN